MTDDQAARDAAKLLPCSRKLECDYRIVKGAVVEGPTGRHSEFCIASFRPAVADALRARDERIVELEREVKDRCVCRFTTSPHSGSTGFMEPYAECTSHKAQRERITALEDQLRRTQEYEAAIVAKHEEELATIQCATGMVRPRSSMVLDVGSTVDLVTRLRNEYERRGGEAAMSKTWFDDLDAVDQMIGLSDGLSKKRSLELIEELRALRADNERLREALREQWSCDISCSPFGDSDDDADHSDQCNRVRAALAEVKRC